MKRILLIAAAGVITIILGLVNANADQQELQVVVPIRFISVNADFFERIGVDFDFAVGTEMFRTIPGFGVGVNGGVLFPNAIGNTDVIISGSIFGNRFGADNITNQFGNTFPADGSITDIGAGLNVALLLQLAELETRRNTLSAPRISPNSVDLKLSAGGGLVNRNVKIDITGTPYIDDSAVAPFGELGIGIQFPLNLPNQRHETALYLGVNHRVVGGVNLRTIPNLPFRMRHTSTTSVKAELIIFIKPRVIPVTEE